MPISPDSLPDDIEALKALLLARDGEVEQLRTTVSTLAQALSVRGLEIEQLKLQLAKLKRMQFGRKSERIDRKIEELEPDSRTWLQRKARANSEPNLLRRAVRLNASRCRSIWRAKSACSSHWKRPARSAGVSSSR
jgi:SMC interacting uncharacterized protein involved in chromosome segregation